ncbi:DUF397 domain-containing protein [Streptomyces niveus]|uniref:DUF397 domain-containing protein n=1 Tax=Streptomyces niveus TaxID=193462 RepID=A0ABZ2A7F4_STRNV|nr:DUF397 domain-containing protein [Streptomyces niveus]
MQSEEIVWQKSSFSTGNTNCVELAASGDAILLRESDAPHEVVVTSPVKLRAFLAGVKAGEFDHLV